MEFTPAGFGRKLLVFNGRVIAVCVAAAGAVAAPRLADAAECARCPLGDCNAAVSCGSIDRGFTCPLPSLAE